MSIQTTDPIAAIGGEGILNPADLIPMCAAEIAIEKSLRTGGFHTADDFRRICGPDTADVMRRARQAMLRLRLRGWTKTRVRLSNRPLIFVYRMTPPD